MPSELTGLITDIQRFAVHDGPGIRTLVFMKGCPLRCPWCANPETQEIAPRLSYRVNRCIRCGACVQACASQAITVGNNGRPKTNRTLCRNCGKCRSVCFSKARELVGRPVTIPLLLSEIERDAIFYRNSGGGLTVGGGEPCRQAAFVSQLLQAAQEEYGLHTAVETCGYARLETLRQTIRYAQLVYYDIKHMDEEKHRQLTGVSNKLILGNLKRIAQSGISIIVRFPIVLGLTDGQENVRATAAFVKSLGSAIVRVELLPYHGYGSSKYAQLGRRYRLSRHEPPSDGHMAALRQIVESFGLPVQIGG